MRAGLCAPSLSVGREHRERCCLLRRTPGGVLWVCASSLGTTAGTWGCCWGQRAALSPSPPPPGGSSPPARGLCRRSHRSRSPDAGPASPSTSGSLGAAPQAAPPHPGGGRLSPFRLKRVLFSESRPAEGTAGRGGAAGGPYLWAAGWAQGVGPAPGGPGGGQRARWVRGGRGTRRVRREGDKIGRKRSGWLSARRSAGKEGREEGREGAGVGCWDPGVGLGAAAGGGSRSSGSGCGSPRRSSGSGWSRVTVAGRLAGLGGRLVAAHTRAAGL